MTDLAKWARHYTTLGLAVVPIPKGMKGPRDHGWNDPANTVRTRLEAHQKFSGVQLNMGVLHSASGTGTLDVDHEDWCALALASLGLSLDTFLRDAPIKIKGKNGEKPFYRLPDGVEFERRSLSWPHPTEKTPSGRPKPVTVFELRGGAVQDVLPPSIHPDTGRPYEWVGTPPRTRQDIPLIPPELLNLWQNWDELVKVMRNACPWAEPEQPSTPFRAAPRTPGPVGDAERPGDAFRAKVNIREVLERNGYQPRGDRYLPPGSKTKVAGVRILMGEDGIERAFSDHGSCDLNDGHAHDSLSALVILEHRGDFLAAVKAAAAELGMEPPERRAQGDHGPVTVEEVQRRWAQEQAQLITQGCMVLDNAQGNPRQKGALFDLWALLTEFACSNVIERGGRFFISPGGLANIKANGITGRPADVASRLRYLGTLGFHRGVTKSDMSDPASPLIVEISADPHELPFMSHTKESSKRLTVAVPTFRRRNPETLAKVTTKRKSLTDSCYLTPCFGAAAGTVACLMAVPDATTAELAELRGKSVETIRGHVRALKTAGMVSVSHRRVTLTATWTQLRELLRLERENDPAFRQRIRRALESTVRYCEAGLRACPPLPEPQLKRRRSMLRVATRRLERLDAGEPVSEVMKWAA